MCQKCGNPNCSGPYHKTVADHLRQIKQLAEDALAKAETLSDFMERSSTTDDVPNYVYGEMSEAVVNLHESLPGPSMVIHMISRGVPRPIAESYVANLIAKLNQLRS